MSSSRGVHCEIDKMEIIDEHKDGSIHSQIWFRLDILRFEISVIFFILSIRYILKLIKVSTVH